MAVIAADVLAIAALLWLAISRANRWPEPTPRPYGCVACRVDYSDARALAWHQQGQHVETYEAVEIGARMGVPGGAA